MDIEWTGNVLTNAGCLCTIGECRVELMKVDPSALGHYIRPIPTQINRSWMVYIYRSTEMTIYDIPIASLILFDLMPGRAKEEAAKLLCWADAFYSSNATA